MEGFLMRGWDHIPPGWRWELVVRTPGCGFYTVQGRIDPGDNHIRPQCVGAADVWKDRRSGGCTMSSPGVVGPTKWGFYTVGGGIDPGDHSFIPCFLGVVAVSKDF